MASIYFRLDKSGNKRYYGSIYNNGKRIRKFLGCSRQSAQALIKKFEYELLLNIESSTTENKPISFEQAILSFKKDIERTGVKVKQISVITNKVNYFKNYCFSLGINELGEISRSPTNSYMNYRNATSLTSSTLNKETGFPLETKGLLVAEEWFKHPPFGLWVYRSKIFIKGAKY